MTQRAVHWTASGCEQHTIPEGSGEEERPAGNSAFEAGASALLRVNLPLLASRCRPRPLPLPGPPPRPLPLPLRAPAVRLAGG